MRPSRDQMLMEICEVVSKRTTCERRQVGAVIARNGRVLSLGYAGAPSGLPHCSPAVCDASTPCRRTIHAEQNAIAWAAREGIATDGATLYCTTEPCLECAKVIINAGIRRVVFRDPYRVHEGRLLLQSVGIEVIPYGT